MGSVEWTTTADADAVRTALREVLEAMRYTVTTDEGGWTGRAQVGSPVLRAVVGAWARRMVVGWELTAGESPDALHLRVSALVSGWSGGIAGASKAQAELDILRRNLDTEFGRRGLTPA